MMLVGLVGARAGARAVGREVAGSGVEPAAVAVELAAVGAEPTALGVGPTALGAELAAVGVSRAAVGGGALPGGGARRHGSVQQRWSARGAGPWVQAAGHRNRLKPLASVVMLVLGGALLAPSVMAQAQAEPGTGAPAETAPADARAPDDTTSALPAVWVRGISLSPVTERTGRYTAAQTSRSTGLRLSPRETPQAVTVVTRREMDDRGMQSIRDVLGATTGVHTSNDWMRPAYYARGMDIENIMVDGIRMLRGYQGVSDIQMDGAVAYDRMEVVRGATGLLSGSGEPSAAVNLHRKRATRERQAHVGASFGSWNAWHTEVDASGPLNAGGSVRGRVAASLGDADHYIDHAGRRSRAIYATLEADLTPDTTVRAGYQQDVWRLHGVNMYSSVPIFWNDGRFLEAPRSLAVSPRNWWADQNARTAFLGLEQKLGNEWDLNLNVAYTRRKVKNQPTFKVGIDSFYPAPDGSLPTSAYDFTPFPVEDGQWGHDLSVQGPFGLLGRRHELGAGVNGYSYRRDVLGWNVQEDLLPESYYTDVTLWNLADRGLIRNYEMNGQYVNRGVTREAGAWLAVRWNLADSLKLISGARVTRHHAYSEVHDEDTGALTQARASEQRFDHELVPYLGVVWDFGRDWSAYASYTDIFKPTGQVDAQDRSLPPETGRSYEIGLKSAINGGRLQTGIAVFRAVKDDVAVPDPAYPDDFLTPAGNRPNMSAGKGNVSKGVELELAGELARRWQVHAGYAYATLEDATGADLIPNTPKHLLRVFTQYRLPGRLDAFTVGGGISWHSAIERQVDRPTGTFGEDGAPVTAPWNFRQKGVVLADLMLRHQASKRLSVTLNVNNLFDRKYYSAISQWESSAIWGTPRRVRLGVRYDF